MIAINNVKFLPYFFLIPFLFNSQTKRFYYNLNFKPSDDSSLIQKEILVLDINADKNLFYSNEYLRIDSLNNTNSTFKFAYPKFKKIIAWENKKNTFKVYNNLSMNYYFYSTSQKIEWILTGEKKKIGDYLVQKAIGSYGKRMWNVWFTNEIALPYGPYFFNGLPGLVLEAYDDDYNYHFSFIQNKNFSTITDSEKIIEKYLGVRKFEIKEDEWPKVLLNYYNNPIPEYKQGNAIRLKNDGTQFSDQDYRELERNLKFSIKNNNNPIDLNERINYP
ncbi:GLPGLI family protein [Chryseobacterium salivictor]|uniref:GLPGLI family protein n=1 Tax=Chryseobacterium salivictor TaxID=2547600 RepID=A0A4P6ZF07_9FLAO|nr:GLPGLI family protein [Chryseobacterium salivictor]QBO58022.1 hypothetical protein NBC122_01195 [Chryseobacterium salivictor]